MIENKLEAANEDNLKQISNYKYNNELLDRIIFNKHLCDREEIELIRDSILSNNLNFHTTKIKLANDQKWLMNKNISSDFLANNFQLELTINKFWYKFYSKCFQNEKEIINYWRNEFLDCYKKQFFLKKVEKNKSKLLENDISEINQDLKSNLILSSSSKSKTLKFKIINLEIVVFVLIKIYFYYYFWLSYNILIFCNCDIITLQ